jgi:hypothetical protein
LNYFIKSIVNKISSTNCGLLEGCGLLLVKNLNSLDISKLLPIFKNIKNKKYKKIKNDLKKY